jgi:hypothetical protein
MSKNRFEQIWNFWHYSDNSTLGDEADRLYKIRPVLDNLLEKFRKRSQPPQELLPDRPMIPWRELLRFRTHNFGKHVKYGILVNMVCEVTAAILAISKYVLQKVRSWKRPYFLLWDLTLTYGTIFTRITIIIVLKLQRSYS